MVDRAYIQPVKPCCGQSHPGVVCNDGRVMCCLCFKKFDIDQLHVNDAGETEDVCATCGQQEAERVAGLKTESWADGPPSSGGAARQTAPPAQDSRPKCTCPHLGDLEDDRLSISKLAEQGDRCPVHGISPYREVD